MEEEDDTDDDPNTDTEETDIPSLNVQAKHSFKIIFQQPQSLFPDNFESKKTKRAYCTESGINMPLLILTKMIILPVFSTQ